MAKRTTRAANLSKAVVARAYLSPTLVLLAMDWPAGAQAKDFLGFAILRSPGFTAREKDGYLFNKIGFSAPTEDAQPLPSNLAPIQKFLWWDAGINDKDRGKTFRYTITPVRGTGPNDLVLQHDSEMTIAVTLPTVEQDGISTWFNRAVVSSQAFSREFPDPAKDIPKAMDWLANGLQDAFADILSGARSIEGAVYHFTDKRWVVPALKGFKGKLSLVYEDQKRDETDLPAIALLKSAKFEGWPRSKTAIMHDKFLVDIEGGRVLTGSANFTPEGLTTQANLLHILESPQLAKLYGARQELISKDPTVAVTAKGADWSKPVRIGKSTVRVFFTRAHEESAVDRHGDQDDQGREELGDLLHVRSHGSGAADGAAGHERPQEAAVWPAEQHLRSEKQEGRPIAFRRTAEEAQCRHGGQGHALQSLAQGQAGAGLFLLP